MKIQIDSENKIIRLENDTILGELIKYLDKLLPKNSQIGYWKDFKLETNTIIYNWSNPVTFTEACPTISPLYGEFVVTNSVVNLELN